MIAPLIESIKEMRSEYTSKINALSASNEEYNLKINILKHAINNSTDGNSFYTTLSNLLNM